MDNANHFQLGTGLETGAQTEGYSRKVMDSAHSLEIVAGTDVLNDNREDHFIRKDGIIYAGNHLIIEVENGTGLDDEARIQKAFLDCVDQCGATLLHIHTHKFSPQGVSGVAVLAESHISCHTWPEIGYGAFDVFMCGDAKPSNAVGVLKKAFETNDVHVKSLRRGEGLVAEALA